ncbi:ATP-dependent Clp protease ATP-binding subunit [Streptococcus sp. X16XC17]|uniref:ATP-dependent Clp protease ATP-binding subunit n=1 Tax=unclassified Streptococcus TaxID=2608887 RepID=UPI00066FF52F|nr:MULTISPECIES: ATP-dependent Clp protease ATP-binding subunit [unclassified Streptococcus]TCD45785.1 ATP-dependent Clp protease ATP-binding subunit [Streptococcus sp. X16XC17]
MKFSKGLEYVLGDAQLMAQRYMNAYVETWHVVLAFLINANTIAGTVLAEYPVELTEYEQAAFAVTEKEFNEEEDQDEFNTLAFSKKLQERMNLAEKIAEVVKAQEVGTEHVFMSFLLDKRSTAVQVLDKVGFHLEDSDDAIRLVDLRKNLEKKSGFTKEDLKAIRALVRGGAAPQTTMANMMGGMPPGGQSGGLEDYTRDLTALAREGKMEPVIGRDREISRMIQILSRKKKNNPVLVGDAGVGKTALALGLAQRVAEGAVPASLSKMRVLELELMNVIAGTRFRGDFEERMNNIINDIEEDGQVILFIDELHTIMGSGSGIDSTLDAANILKPALSRGTLRTVGATTQEEYQKHIEKDAALSRRFAKVLVEEPSVEDSKIILRGLKTSYEAHHGVTITDEAIVAAVEGAKRYLTNKNLPDSAIDLLDEASATVQNSRKASPAAESLSDLDAALKAGKYKKVAQLLVKNQEKPKGNATLEVTEDHVLTTLSHLSGIPVTKLTRTDAKKYLNLEAVLHKRVIGQDEAISAVSRAIRRNQSGIRTGKRPIGSFMFLGPTGVGKTELAKALAEVLFDDESALIRFDMSEYMEKFSASRLNGAPPGYVGYEEGGELTEKVRNKPYSVLLFDEVEKAHPDIFNVLLPVLDDGVLTDSKGRKVDFSNTLIIMTSNLGATALRDDKTVGFGALDLSRNHKEVEKRIFEELKKAYRPEFLNRIDEKVVFHSLSDKDMQEVVKIMVKPLIAATEKQGIALKVQPSALKLLAKDGYDREMGARPLRRTIQTQVEDQLAELLLSGQLQAGQNLKIGVKSGRLKFEIEG